MDDEEENEEEMDEGGDKDEAQEDTEETIEFDDADIPKKRKRLGTYLSLHCEA